MKKIIKDRKALANIAGEELIIYIIGTAREFINDEFVDVVDYEYLRDGNWEFDVERKDKVEIIKYLYDPKKININSKMFDSQNVRNILEVTIKHFGKLIISRTI